MIIYNAKIMFIIESEYVYTNHLLRSCQDVMIYHLVLWLCLQDVMIYYPVLWLCLLKCKACTTIFVWLSMSSFILT